jgi:hypothetical protein
MAAEPVIDRVRRQLAARAEQASVAMSPDFEETKAGLPNGGEADEIMTRPCFPDRAKRSIIPTTSSACFAAAMR